MFWYLYLSSVGGFCYLISKFSKKHSGKLFIFFFVTLVTPSQIEVNKLDLSPAVFTFFYNVLFEQNFSLRVLRPLVLTLSIYFISIALFLFFKKRFSQYLNF